MYLPKQIASKLNISPGTLRNWSNEFKDFLSADAGKALTDEGGAAQRRYNDEDLAVLARVKSMRRQSPPKSYGEITEILRGNQGLPIAANEDATALATHTAPMALVSNEQITEAVRTAISEVVKAKDETISVLRSENERLRSEVDELKQQGKQQISRHPTHTPATNPKDDTGAAFEMPAEFETTAPVSAEISDSPETGTAYQPPDKPLTLLQRIGKRFRR